MHGAPGSMMRASTVAGRLGPRISVAVFSNAADMPSNGRGSEWSPSTVKAATDAPHSRIAFSSIASNTGARLPGEALMTCNTSAVAVCCSSASCCSVSSRAFSIAITA